MNGALNLMLFGFVYAGLAVLFGLLAPHLWPRKDLTKANRLLRLVWRLGLACVLFGAFVFVLHRLT